MRLNHFIAFFYDLNPESFNFVCCLFPKRNNLSTPKTSFAIE